MWPNPQFPANLVTFTEEILNGKLQFLCSEPDKEGSYVNLKKKWLCIKWKQKSESDPSYSSWNQNLSEL